MYNMELMGVEPMSAIGIYFRIIHRFSLSNPQGGNRSLSRTVGFFNVIFTNKPTKENLLVHPLGFASNP
jgi:hypothetical protein